MTHSISGGGGGGGGGTGGTDSPFPMNNDVMHTANNKRSKGMQFANHRIVPYIITIDMYGVLQYQAHHCHDF